jgi:CDP-diglyceride synthetase
MHQFITRTITSTVLLSLVIGAFFYLSPMQLSLIIGVLYWYAGVTEFIPLSLKSWSSAPKVTVLAGVALATTGALHVYWATQYLYLYLYICIGAAIMSDTAGYLAGNLFGKHLLAPTISPKKTWEGLAGSIILTSVTFFIVTKLFLALNAYIAALLGALLAIAALGGDLLISYLKRAADVKDTGTILPGHGGVLDRLDSIIGTTIAFLALYGPFMQMLLQIDRFYPTP